MKRLCCPKIPYKKVTHVIFDLDGTILDTETLIQEVLTEICKKCEKNFAPHLHNKTAGSLVEDIAKLLIGELDLPITEDEFIAMYKELTVSRCSSIKFMPGAEQLIKHFHDHNVPIAVATSSAQDLMLLKTQNHRKVFDLFHHIVCAGSDPEVMAGKPAPDIFLVCASRFEDSPSPSECLVFEDAPNGIMGAQSAGMQVVMIPAQDVPYEIWKNATLRLDSLEYMAPELFGLPPLINQSYPFPKISFTMHYDSEKKPEEAAEQKKEEEQRKKEEHGKKAKRESSSDEDWFPDEVLLFTEYKQ